MIKGHTLQLRALEKADLTFLHRLHNSYKTMNYFFEEPFETLRELEDLYEKYVHNTTERRFVIEEIATGNSVGVLSLIEIDEINRKCEIDIIIDEKFQGRSFGKQGFVLGIKYAFDILNLFKIYLLLLPNNTPGLNIYKFAGFKKECRLRKEFFRNGEYVDVERMCLFENQWRKSKARLNEYVGFESVEIRHSPRRTPLTVPISAAAKEVEVVEVRASGSSRSTGSGEDAVPPQSPLQSSIVVHGS
jgi:diamine N-acetyltransferase